MRARGLFLGVIAGCCDWLRGKGGCRWEGGGSLTGQEGWGGRGIMGEGGWGLS